MSEDNRKTQGTPISYRILKREAESILIDHDNGLACRDIGRKYSRPHSTIIRFLEKHGKSIKSSYDRSKKYTVIEDYFSKIDSHKKAYWLGWLMSDGYVLPNMKETRLRLQVRDKFILEEMLKDLNCNVPLKYLKKPPTGIICEQKNQKEFYESYGFSISCSQIAQDLHKYGIIPGKSKTNSCPKNIPDEFVSSFILGEFEGDGSISIGKNKAPCMVIYDCQCVCDYIKNFVDKNAGRSVGYSYKRAGANVWMYSISNEKDIRFFYDLIYNNRGFDFCLFRKLKKFDDYLNNRDIFHREFLERKTSKYRGVCFLKNVGKFCAAIERNGVKHILGYSHDEEAMARAYNEKAIELLGDKAKLNKFND